MGLPQVYMSARWSSDGADPTVERSQRPPARPSERATLFGRETNGPAIYSYIKYCFWAFVLLYGALLCIKPSFGLIDDHLFVPSILVGHRLPFYTDPALGRFAPLEGQEYNVVAMISSTPFAFYLFNALQLVLAAWLLVEIGQADGTARKSSVAYMVAAAIMLTPAFVNGWMRLLVPERNEFVLLAIYFLCYLKFQKQQKAGYYVTAVVAAAIALLCKETAFILVGGLGFVHLLLDRSSYTKKRLFDLSLMAVSAIWLCTYYFASYRFRGPHLYNARSGGLAHLIAETLAFDFLVDPVVTVGIFLLLSVRGIQLFRGARFDPIFDATLLSGSLFFLAYVMLHMNSAYYLLPMYVVVPYVIASARSHVEMKSLFKPWAAVLFGILLASQVALALQQVALWKLAPSNFQVTLSVLTADFSKSPQRVNLFMAGTDVQSDIYGSLLQYLSLSGLGADRVNLKSNPPEAEASPDGPLTATTSTDNQIAQGDYVLVTPFDTINRRSEFANRSQYERIFRTDSSTYPDLSIKVLIRRLVPGKSSQVHKGLVNPNFYVYRRIGS